MWRKIFLFIWLCMAVYAIWTQEWQMREALSTPPAPVNKKVKENSPNARPITHPEAAVNNDDKRTAR